MPFIYNKSLCQFCKYYRLDEDSRKCDAFPDGIPVALYAAEMEYDHHEPYPGDNGIQFERLHDEEELKKRFPRFSREHFQETVEYSLNETLEILYIGRRDGWIQPPLRLNGEISD